VAGAYAAYNGLWNVPGLIGGHICGTEEQFLNGYDPANPGPPLVPGPDGIPTCCPRALVGQVSFALAPNAHYGTRIYPGPPKGGIRIGGFVVVNPRFVPPVQGGLRIGGAQGQFAQFTVPNQGGLRIGGAQALIPQFTVAPQGGLRIGGAQAQFAQFTVAPKGGLKIGGAQANTAQFTVTPAGGIRIGGAVTHTAQFTVTPAGGIRIGGAVTHTAKFTLTPAGGIRTGGSVAHIFGYLRSPSGGIKIGGSVANQFTRGPLVSTRQQQAKQVSTGASSISASWSTGTTTGNFLVAVVGVYSSGTAVTPPLGWTAGPSFGTTGGYRVYTFYIPASGSRSGAEVFSFTGGISGIYPFAWLVLTEYVQLRQFVQVDVSGTAAASGSLTSPALTIPVSYGGELVICVIINESQGGGTNTMSSPTSGFTLLLQEDNQNGGDGLLGGYLDRLDTSTTGSYGTQVTLTSNLECRTALVAFE
jgi:hypothetical protein